MIEMHMRDFVVNLMLKFILTGDKKKCDKQGLGTINNYWTNAGYHPLDKGTVYDIKSYLFTKSTTNDFMHIDYISQDARVNVLVTEKRFSV